MRAGVLQPAVDDPPARAGGEAARERDHAVAVALEQLHVDAGLAAVQALEEAGAGELGQVAEALVALREQRQVVALDLALADRAVVDEVRLEPQDRLDAVLAARLEELDRAVHHAVVGEPERRLLELRGAGGELVDLAGAVEQRVLGVDVQVGAGGRAHGRGKLRCPIGRPRRRLARTLRETVRRGQPPVPCARSVQARRSATAARSPRIAGRSPLGAGSPRRRCR